MSRAHIVIDRDEIVIDRTEVVMEIFEVVQRDVSLAGTHRVVEVGSATIPPIIRTMQQLR